MLHINQLVADGASVVFIDFKCRPLYFATDVFFLIFEVP